MLGKHMLLDLYKCDASLLNDELYLQGILLKAAKESGATILDNTFTFHKFAPQGVSGVVVISESHFSIHTWPEFNYAAVDIFTCGNSINMDMARDIIASGVKSLSVQNRTIYRGEM